MLTAEHARGLFADYGTQEQSRTTVANIEIIEFDGREISPSCLLRLRRQRRNGATDDDDGHNNCLPLCRRIAYIDHYFRRSFVSVN